MSRSGTSKRRALGRRGSLPLEMAYVASALLLLLLGGVEISRYFFVSETVRHLVGELARAAVINPDQDFTSVKAALVDRTKILKLTDFTTLNVTPVSRRPAPELTTISVSAVYKYKFHTPVLSTLVSSIDSNLTLSFVAP